MIYCSAKETAELWGITPRRVALLASQGRIEGAVLKGNTWLIPENTPKPADGRKKGGASVTGQSRRWCFPHILCIVHSEEQLRSFTTEERSLYEMELLLDAGNFSAALPLAQTLSESKDLYIRLGALFNLPSILLNQGEYERAEKYIVLFLSECSSAIEEHRELSILWNLFVLDLGRRSDCIPIPDYTDLLSANQELLPLLSSQLLLNEVWESFASQHPANIAVYELLSSHIDSNGYFYVGLYIHYVLSVYYASIDNAEQEQRHIKRAIEIALEHNTIFTLLCLLSYNPFALESVLQDIAPENAQRFRELVAGYNENRVRFRQYHNRYSVFATLSDDEFRLLSYCMRHYSAERMARSFNLSVSGISRRLNRLFDKLGVCSRKELEQLYCSFITDWGSD